MTAAVRQGDRLLRGRPRRSPGFSSHAVGTTADGRDRSDLRHFIKRPREVRMSIWLLILIILLVVLVLGGFGYSRR
jgi:hypothetical protein